MRRTAAAALLLTALTTGGCSHDAERDCSGSTYQPDLDAKGATTPITALEDWLGTDADLPDPPDDGWVVQDTGAKHPSSVVIINEDSHGWWVELTRTDPGGWVVEQATAKAQGCSDLPGGA